MIETINSHGAGVTLVGGGPVLKADLDETLKIAPVLVAADGGADIVLKSGRMPDWAIGDLDSISQGARDRIGAARVIHDRCQETTDFQKCLSRISAPFILGLGFLGGQVDHELAALGTLVQPWPQRIVLIGAQDVITHVPDGIDLELEQGSRFSLYPLRPVTGRSQGLNWPIDGLDFAPGVRGGTSNRVTGPVRLRFDGPGMLVILPRAALGALLSAPR